jgi:hypothetical protein
MVGAEISNVVADRNPHLDAYLAAVQDRMRALLDVYFDNQDLN